ncbi:MAG TPA: FHA domain-containing protein [Candidatus Binataceae bacterium]|nr:FHA domain-containing protein [Candidatus Binataceae bacterium]
MASQPEAARGDSATGEVKGRLVAIGGGAEYPLDKPLLKVGSHRSNDIVLDDTTVSRNHATIARRLGRFTLTDLDSTNGTIVNGKRIKGAAILKPGDEVRFGAMRFAFLTGATIARRRTRPMLAIALLAMFAVGFAAARYFLGPRPIHTATVAIRQSLEAKTASSAAPSASAGNSSVPVYSAAAAPAPEWLQRLNSYRDMAKLAPAGEDDSLATADAKHVAYLFTNYADDIMHGIMPGLEMHQESSDKPGYSADGLYAAQHSDVDFMWWRGSYKQHMETWAIDDWITGAFHRLPLLSPRLERVGYAQQCENQMCVAAMNAQTDVEHAAATTMYKIPVAFPPDGATLALKWFTMEVPNPLSSCPDYQKPTGVPITLQLGNFIAIKLDNYSLKEADSGDEVEACGFDSSTYTNPDPAIQAAARASLNAFGTVVVIPRQPLKPGASYNVEMTASGKKYNWQFSVAP